MENSYILIFLISSAVLISPYFSKILKLPIAPVEIIIGSLMVYFGLINMENSNSINYFSLFSEIGFLYLMFLVGLEIKIKNILKLSFHKILKIFVFLMLISALALIIGFSLNLHTVLIVSFPLISLGLLPSLTKEYGKTKWITLAFTIGTIGEVISILFITIFEVSTSLGYGNDLLKKIILLIELLFIIVVVYHILKLLFWWFPLLKNKLMPYDNKKEEDVRLAFGVFSILISLMLFLHLELAFGAFIAGLFMSTFFENIKNLETKLSSFGFGFLIPIFFIHTGASFNIEYLTYDIMKNALLIIFTMFFIRFIAIYIYKKEIGSMNIILTSLSLSMPLTLLIAIATISLHNKVITLHDYYTIVLASILEVIIAMILIKRFTRNKNYNKF